MLKSPSTARTAPSSDRSPTANDAMDSFTVVIRGQHSDDELRAALLETGAEVLFTAPAQVVVTQKDAAVWVDSYSIGELPASELRNQQNWPLPSQEVGSVAKVLVSRTGESEPLAIKIAHQLVTKLRGVIRWDGMEYWRGLYERHFHRDSLGYFKETGRLNTRLVSARSVGVVVTCGRSAMRGPAWELRR
jgi:hypothetical protein